jgi:uncharacterized protein YbjT (DUF2867 family)
MTEASTKTIAVIGATGQQGGGVVRALEADGRFRVRALTRDPARYDGPADEVVAADLNRPETLAAAFDGAYGVFAVTNAWDPDGADEIAQGRAAVNAARQAGVQHFIWSTLPDAEAISGGKYDVPHFTNKARIDAIVAAAGFPHHSFVIAPFFYQNLLGALAPQPQQDGSTGWTLPIDPAARVIHTGDITELGRIVAGAFADPGTAGGGQYLPLVGELLSFDDIIAVLARQGHSFTFNQVPADVFATFFPGARELAQMFGYFGEHTRITLANKVAGTPASDFAAWARSHMPAHAETAA